MKLNKRKGFTIVELVIVIAVIAILAAVLIPNISNLVKKANASADESLVRNLNTALSMDVEKHQTMDAALEAALKNGGYELTTIVTKNKDNKILWDSKNDCFVYMKKGATQPTYLPNTQEVKDVKDWDLFEIVDAVPGLNDQKYSIYLTGDANSADVKVKVGFDAGKNTGIPTITYERDVSDAGRSVIIRTNGGTLKVDAKSDSIYHYNKADNVEVISVKNESYHEYGKVIGYLSVTSGHVKVEDGAVVVTVYIETVNAKVTVPENVQITVNPEAIKEGSKVTINGTQYDSNTIGNLKNVSTIDETTKGKFQSGAGTPANPFVIATAEQFKNIGLFSEAMKGGKAISFKLSADISLNTEDFTNGTISNYFCGTLDGDGKTITVGVTSPSTYFILKDTVGTATFKNVNYVMTQDLVRFNGGIYKISGNNDVSPVVVFDNVDMSTTGNKANIKLEENLGLYGGWIGASENSGEYGYFGENKIKYTIKDCDVNMNLVGYSYNAVFIGGGLYYTDATVENCTYTGNFYGDKTNLVLGNTAPYFSTITIKNVENKGSIFSTISNPKIAGGAYNSGSTKGNESCVYTGNGRTLSVSIESCSIGTVNFISDSALSIQVTDATKKLNSSIKATAAASDSSYYILTFIGGKRITSSNSENSSYRLNIKITADKVSDIANYKTGKLITKADIALVGLTDADISNVTWVDIYGEAGAKVAVAVKENNVYFVCDFPKTEADFEMFFATTDNNKFTHIATEIHTVELTAYNGNNNPIGKSIVKWGQKDGVDKWH